MFLRATTRKKDGKVHRYYSVVQRHVLYLGGINSNQELAWQRSFEVIEDGAEPPAHRGAVPGGSDRGAAG